MQEKIAVVGLGYVGLPIAAALGKKFDGVIGFDVNQARVAELKEGKDSTHEVTSEDLASTKVSYTADAEQLRDVSFFIVAVPTPIDEGHAPDLTAVKAATRTIAKVMSKGSVVVYESTVYPGVTEDECAPLLAEVSGLSRADFKIGYSPERINPGDREHTLERVVKVVSGEDEETLERVANVYGAVISAGVHRAPSIKVAEAAKVIENIQRDINVALMNEIALICERVGIRTADVLQAARTKWNFLPFEPGLVGGHCIGVDPYYLTSLAERLGYHPQVILAGRRINESMGPYLAQRMVQLLATRDVPIRRARVGVLGLAFKPDVPDLRNTKVIDVVRELEKFGIDAIVHDPMVNPEEAKHEYDIALKPWSELTDLDAVVFAVPHKEFLKKGAQGLLEPLRKGGIFMDVKSAFSPSEIAERYTYVSL